MDFFLISGEFTADWRHMLFLENISKEFFCFFFAVKEVEAVNQAESSDDLRKLTIVYQKTESLLSIGGVKLCAPPSELLTEGRKTIFRFGFIHSPLKRRSALGQALTILKL